MCFLHLLMTFHHSFYLYRPSHDIYDLRWTKRSNLYGDRLYGKRSGDEDDGYYGFNLLGKRLYNSRMNGKRLYDDRMVGKRLYDDRMIAGKRLYGDRTYGKRNGLYDYRMLN